MGKKEHTYFEDLSELAHQASLGAQLLEAALQIGGSEDLAEKLKAMRTLAGESRIQIQVMESRLTREFITPIDRGDIIIAAQAIVDVISAMEMAMLDLSSGHSCCGGGIAREAGGLVYTCCTALEAVFKEFHNLKKTESLRKKINELLRLQEQSRSIFSKEIKRIYDGHRDLIEVIVQNQTLRNIQICCENCYYVAHLMSAISLKNG